MNLLALDTATERLALALAVGDVSATSDTEGGASASAQLIPQALDLLRRHGLRVADLDAIAFGRGPGAFTGLRTAVSVAQGLAFGAGKPVLSIDSLMIVADDARAQASHAGPATAPFAVWVAMDARMEQVYAAAYVFEPAGEGGSAGAWRVTVAPALYDLPALNQRWSAAPPAEIAGSALSAFGERLQPGTARRWPRQDDRPAALLRLARTAWRSGATLPAEQALPLYLRDKVALTTAERLAQREAQQAGATP